MVATKLGTTDNGGQPRGKIIEDRAIDALIDSLLVEFSESFYSVKISDTFAREELAAVVDSTLRWTLDACQRGFSLSNNKSVKVTSVSSSEELSWSPALGLKGQLDMVFDCSKVGDPNCFGSLPLELKTGRWRPSMLLSHRAQVIIPDLQHISDRR